MLGQRLTAAGVDLAFTPVAVVLAQLFVAGPFYVKAAISAFATVDREVEQATKVGGGLRCCSLLIASSRYGAIF